MWDPVVKMDQGQRGPCVGGGTMASEGWGEQQRVEARVGTGSVGAEVTRTGFPAPHTQCLIRGCSATALRAEILLSLLQRVAFQRRLVLVCAGDGAGGEGRRKVHRPRVPACTAPRIRHSNPASAAPSCRCRPGCVWSSAGEVGRGTPEFTGDYGRLSQEEAGAFLQQDRWGSSPRWGVRTQVEV